MAVREPLNVQLAGFIDVETTGLSKYRDEIVEFCMVLFSFRPDTGELLEIVEEYTGLREPGIPIHPAAARVHGLYMENVRGCKLDEARIEHLIQLADILIAHNASFDRSFVERMFPAAAAKPWYCSMRGIDWYAEGFSSRGLQNLLKAHGIEVGRAHRAEDDVKAAIKLLCQRGRNGETYLCKMLRNHNKRGA
ncbi:MAG: DNA polymerase III subunit epsilon [Thermoanaerobacteraceae bacterium]|nr:DNA polymerase III subunit epsilon [Thermoanaerobacteraceae bacterium]